MSILLHSLRFALCPNSCSFEEHSIGCGEEYVFCSVRVKCSVKSSWSMMSFNVHVSVYFFLTGKACQLIGISRVLEAPTTILLMLLGGFTPNHICFIKLGAPMFRAYVFRVMFSSRIVPLIRMK